MNKVFLNGYLGHDPESKVTAKGLEFTSFSIGVSDLKKWDETFFVRCTAWGTTAKYVLNNLTKGHFVSIDGRIIGRSYVNKDGKTSYTTDIVVDNIRGYGNADKGERNGTKSADEKFEYEATDDGININKIEAPKKERVHLEDVFRTKEKTNNIQDNENATNEKSDEWEEL